MRPRRLLARSFTGMLLCAAALSAAWSIAQDPATPPAEEPKAAADGQDAAAMFAKKHDEWKAIIKELRNIEKKYSVAEDTELAGLRAQWDVAIAKGHALIPSVRAAGQAAYVAAPNADRDLSRFLAQLVEDDVRRDRFEDGYELGQILIENDCGIAKIYLTAGIAAFATNDFENAEKYLKRADEAKLLEIDPDAENPDPIVELARKFMGAVADYKAFWKEEQALRAAEAKADDLPRVKLTTSQGEIVLELFENEAPQTVGNFISLVESKFYNGLTFHRVLRNFMAQGGCPQGTGNGGPGYNIPCECHQDGYRKHFRGTLSMAHAGRDTGGSQFFLTFIPTDHLNGLHTAFGRVVEGLDVLPKLMLRDPQKPGATESDEIIKAEVLRKRDHEYVPTKVEK